MDHASRKPSENSLSADPKRWRDYKACAPRTAVVASDFTLKRQAQALAIRFGLPYVASIHNHFPYLLVVKPERIELHNQVEPRVKPVAVEFTKGALGYRLRTGKSRKEPLARAVGVRPSEPLVVFDATAGLGRDGFMLAALGCRVYMLERAPVIAALLEDGLARAARNQQIREIVARITLLHGDALELTPILAGTTTPDVIYLDPMFPERPHSALNKKEMRLFKALIGTDEDSNQLFALAIRFARRRVVVKRPQWASRLAQHSPDFVIDGRTTRFDVYLARVRSSGSEEIKSSSIRGRSIA